MTTIKTSLGRHFNLSPNEWEEIGRIAGWLFQDANGNWNVKEIEQEYPYSDFKDDKVKGTTK